MSVSSCHFKGCTYQQFSSIIFLSKKVQLVGAEARVSLRDVTGFILTLKILDMKQGKVRLYDIVDTEEEMPLEEMSAGQNVLLNMRKGLIVFDKAETEAD